VSKRRKKTSVGDNGQTAPMDNESDAPSSRDDARIRERAYELYLERGDSPGDEVEDWLRAEREHRQSADRVNFETSERSAEQ
jgi:hypothetical protein